VPHPIDQNSPPPRSPSKIQRFLFVGRLNPDKGADLLCGLADLLAETPDTELVVVGRGEYESSIRHQVDLTYYPYRPDVRALMRQASWLLMPSRWEQQPLVLLESIEERLPFIIGPASEILRFGLDDRLMMRTATVDALHACCLAAINLGRTEDEYLSMVNRVGKFAEGWPSPSETRQAMISLLVEAAGL
jgi:glycosyltransferase involved in cell wall biosynthesis